MSTLSGLPIVCRSNLLTEFAWRVLTWMRRSFVAAFVALGAKLAFADR